MPKTRTRAVTAKRARGRRAPLKVQRIAVSESEQAATSYEEALLDGIMASKGRGKATEYSIIFNSVMSSFTPSLRSLNYRHGLSIGRALYRRLNNEKRYIWYEEGAADLVSFLEKAGFTGITYNVFQDMIEIKFNNRDRTFLGTHIHVFESGLISGFLTAGRKQQMRVEEISCSSNGSDFCRFVTTDAVLPFESNSRYVLDRFISSVRPHLESSSAAKASFAEEYAALSSSVLAGREYSEQMRRIICHIGREVGQRLRPVSGRRLEKLYRIIGLGELTAQSMKPLSIKIRFPTLKAKKEFVDISITFLDALLRAAIGDRKTSARHSKEKDSYVLRIKEPRK